MIIVSKTNSMLFKQTNEDREKRITEKVAMILIDLDTNASSKKIDNYCGSTKLKSEYLNKIRNYVSFIYYCRLKFIYEKLIKLLDTNYCIFLFL